MLIREYFSTREDGISLYRSYSDSNMTILQKDTGIEYVEAIDVEGTAHTYEETTNPVPEPEETQPE